MGCRRCFVLLAMAPALLAVGALFFTGEGVVLCFGAVLALDNCGGGDRRSRWASWWQPASSLGRFVDGLAAACV